MEKIDIKLEHVKVFCDSQSALHLTKHQVYHEITKNIDVILHFIHDLVSRKVISMEKISTGDNLRLDPCSLLLPLLLETTRE